MTICNLEDSKARLEYWKYEKNVKEKLWSLYTNHIYVYKINVQLNIIQNDKHYMDGFIISHTDCA